MLDWHKTSFSLLQFPSLSGFVPFHSLSQPSPQSSGFFRGSHCRLQFCQQIKHILLLVVLVNGASFLSIPHLAVAFVLRVAIRKFLGFPGFFLRWIMATARLQQTFTFLKQTLIRVVHKTDSALYFLRPSLALTDRHDDERTFLGSALCAEQSGFLVGDVKEKGRQFAFLDAFIDAGARSE